MIGFKYGFDEKGFAQWHRAFSRFAEEIDDFRPAFKQIVEDFRKMEVRQFSTEGSTGSGGWKPLSKPYAQWKEQVRPGRPILVFEGNLRSAAINPLVTMTKNKLTMEVNDEKAVWHQLGTPRMPARPVIQLAQSDIVRWQKIFHSYMVYEARKPWGNGVKHAV